ncbi:alpha/beta hydrolase [Parafrigoribacterium mesophilum]|uniref:alpha/beta fold hydrolase n=1 Tax=Parafrigoribacterium mesophilum TaxID=433646 RepID=UPI0031FD47B7
MPSLDLPGARLYYETEGQVSSPALLLIHAGVATLRMWDPQVEALARQHYVVRFDTRGYGMTETDNVPFSDRDDALALLDHLGIERATVIGCSRGGAIAIDLAVEHPERVRGLVTIGSGPSGFPEVELTEREDALFDELDALLAAEQWEDLNRRETELWTFGPERNARDLEPTFVAQAYELSAPNIRHHADAPTPTPLEEPAYYRVADIDVPTLVMVGDHDLSEALAQYEYLAATITRADSCRFHDCAHLPSVERPEEFTTVLLNWLSAHGL